MVGKYTVKAGYGDAEGPAKGRHIATQEFDTLTEAAAAFNLIGSLGLQGQVAHNGIALFAPNGHIVAARGEGPALNPPKGSEPDSD